MTLLLFYLAIVFLPFFFAMVWMKIYMPPNISTSYSISILFFILFGLHDSLAFLYFMKLLSFFPQCSSIFCKKMKSTKIFVSFFSGLFLSASLWKKDFSIYFKWWEIHEEMSNLNVFYWLFFNSFSQKSLTSSRTFHFHSNLNSSSSS
jgi:hypothetical protein